MTTQTLAPQTNATQTPTWDQAACTDYAALFADPILDYSRHSPEFADLTPQDHAEKAIQRAAAEADAIDVCMGCPMLFACEQYALENPVYGVAGGRTAPERHAESPEASPNAANATDNERERSARNRVNDEAVSAYTRLGWTNQQIAEHLECTTRTVARSRARLRITDITTPEQAPQATAPVTPAAPVAPATPVTEMILVPQATETHTPTQHRTSAPMRAIHDALTDGQWHHREDLLALGTPLVRDEDAIAWFNRRYPMDTDTTSTDRINRGARAIVDNALSASARTRSRNEYDKASKQYRANNTCCAAAVRTAA